jgi:hypothetical protein
MSPQQAQAFDGAIKAVTQTPTHSTDENLDGHVPHR